ESDGEDLVVISTSGQVIRLPLKGISLIGRATQGVRIMRLKEGDKVASIALIGEPSLVDEATAPAAKSDTVE
ncbi:MAG TPA: DNA gyrase C-terminal beta-propeller domain-containing protein, partial [Candidatus Polarisedimenticolaceae bacterium]|nr:DNA gyrase C-terminal beta-propeller domain-containing protein [Candidatus Polarisedimenticolaceae bacterium]